MSTAQPDDNAGITEIAPDTFVDNSGQQLSEQQVRSVVTPHVFAVAPELIGQPLAKPARRGVAMLIDGFFIAALTSGSLIFVLPMLGYIAWSRWRAAKTGQMALLLSAALLLFVTNSWLPSLQSEQRVQQFSATGAVVNSALQLAQSHCDSACVQQQLDIVIPQLQKANLTVAEQKKALRGLLEASDITRQERSALLQQALTKLKTAAKETAPTADAGEESTAQLSWWQRLQQSDHSILKWIKGILADLGIGFGWAIGYFTLFIAWNNGQTIGKKLCGIRVVQLDNTPLSLWGAFGRQGGYSAGFATGLLGFLQIYWDPNRQAIQDKLADTLVLRLKN
ncbi:RDD family protein [Rheinheimera sp. NSM]|uniref:RDD family protein n=1 Tax=Rheinheimera sp. NSM TaxID=3457884 RepID=UPI0040351751